MIISGTAFESSQLTILQTRLHFVFISEYIVMRCNESSWPFNVYWLQNYSRRWCRWMMWITIIPLSNHPTDCRNHMRNRHLIRLRHLTRSRLLIHLRRHTRSRLLIHHNFDSKFLNWESKFKEPYIFLLIKHTHTHTKISLFWVTS